jgi:hypothetical protein
MTHASSVSDPLLNLADAIEDHTRRHLALLDCVRTLTAFLDPASDSDGSGVRAYALQTAPPIPRLQPPPPPTVRAAPSPQATLLTSPPPPPPPVQAPPPPPLVQTPLAPQATLLTSPPPPPPPVHAPPEIASLQIQSEPSPGLSVRALKRDYDYFSELDEKLAQLGSDLNTHGDEGVDRFTGQSTN